jgi:hypothetical protein
MATATDPKSLLQEYTYTIRLRWKSAEEVDAAVAALPPMPMKNERFEGQRTLSTTMHATALISLQARLACRNQIRTTLGPELWYAAEIEIERCSAK